MPVTAQTEGTDSKTAIDTLLSVRSIRKKFGALEVLKGVSLEIQRGEFLTILGESGSGKTTLLRLIAGFEFPDAGEIWIGGSRIDRLPPFRRPVNTVFQQYALFPHLSVEENVAYGLHIARAPKPEIAQRVQDALAKVKMENFAGAMPSRLSGGQQQRVALARAIVNRPVLLLLDEPLSALDANLRAEMQGELKALQRELGISFVFVTHDQNEAMAMSDRIALLREGEVEQVAPPREIYNRPATAYVAQFVGQTNLLRCEVRNNFASCGPISFPCEHPNGPVTVSLRPECIRTGPSQNHRARFNARVKQRVFHGSVEFLTLECSPELTLIAKVPAGDSVSEPSSFEFDPSSAVVVRD